MTKKSKIGLSIISLILSACICGGVYAAVADELDIENKISTSHISIDVKMTAVDHDGQEIAYESSNQVAVPGGTISQKATVTNTGKPCYIRFQAVSKSEKSLGISDLTGIDATHWVQKGEMYYLITPLEESANVILYDGVNIPTTISKKDAGQDLGFTLKVDAIQSNNFEINFDSDNPWGEATIKEFISTTTI